MEARVSSERKKEGKEGERERDERRGAAAVFLVVR